MSGLPEVSLETNHLLRRARQESLLDDFGSDNFLAPLNVLIDALNNEARLNDIGRFTHYQRILNSLNNRLRMEYWWQKHPEIAEVEIAPPLVIVGLARTGTTMLHRILASDIRFYAPLWYEVRNPAPYIDWQPRAADQRIIEATAEIDALLEANPDFAAIHPMDPVGADEEILLLEHSFYSYVPNAFACIPSYTGFVAGSDNSAAYQYLRRQLQFLQWQKNQRGETAQRWLLKTPHHLHFMDLLLQTFPDAQVVATHRDPSLSVPSVASMNYNLWITGTDNASKQAVAAEWSGLFASGVQHTMAVRELSEKQFFDVWFEDTITRPFDVIAALYEFIGMPFTAEAEAAMQQHREANKREDRPLHEYTLEEYGLTAAGIRAQYNDYCVQFIDTRENLK